MNTVRIKLKPYLREFYTTQYGLANLSSRKNIFGLLLQKFVTYRPASAPIDKPSIDTFELPLISGEGYEARNGNAWVSPKNQEDLERILLAHFKTMYYAYMDDRVRVVRQNQEGTIKDCILGFCVDYGITPNTMNYETLKKAYYRHELLKSQTAQKKTKKDNMELSRPCPLIFKHTNYEPIYAAQY